MAPRQLSPAKRKHGEEQGAAGVALIPAQKRELRITMQSTKPRDIQQPQQKVTPGGRGLLANKGLAGSSGTAGVERTQTRAAIKAAEEDQKRKTRGASATAQPATPAVQPASKAGRAKPSATATGKSATAKGGGKTKPNAGKGGKGGAAAAAAAQPRRRVHLSEATLDEETFHLGDSVYVVLDTAALEGLSDADEEDCACLVCGGTEKQSSVMLECDRCLSGCHLACLTPPLADVPEGEWVCPECASGRAPVARRAASARERFLQRQGLGLARIEHIWQEPDGEYECTLRWYCVPEETHTGRQAHHLAREVFLTQQRDADTMGTILRRAHVLPPRDFQCGATCSALGEDVFVCEYQYDSAWQRFRRRTEFDSDSEDEGGDEWGPNMDGCCESDDEAGDGEVWAERGIMPGGGVRRKAGSALGGGGGGGGGINRRKQGGDEYLSRVGALAVPEHARQQQQQRGPGGVLSQARSMLTLTAVPRTLPCRDAERGQVVEFVEEMLSEDGGKCLYISGIPGTGKTATVLEVMRSLKRKSEAGELPRFQFVEINGLRLPSPQHAYSALYEALTGDRAGPQTAAQALEEMFSSGGGGGKGVGGKGPGGASRRPTIVLVDEMDLLVNKTQTVLYNLFDWPGRKGSRLSIIGIANTMDLPERLHPRIGSRLAGRRVVFQPYSKDQLTTIIKSRLEGVTAFNPLAVELVSRKVANCSGDVRRCLELCRRSAEIAEDRLRKQQRQQDEHQQQQAGSSADQRAGSSGSQQQQESGVVEMRHVAAAIAEMFNTGHVKLLREACRLERLVLAAIYLETCSSGRAECLLLDVWERLRILCSQNCEAQRYDFSSVVERAVELGAKRLIICDPGARRVRVKVALNVAVNDLLMVLTEDPDLPWLEQAISRAALAPVQVAAE